jgi:hypothetical protein
MHIEKAAFECCRFDLGIESYKWLGNWAEKKRE